MVDNLLVFVKLNNNVPTIQYAIGYVRESLQSNCERFYYTNDKDTATIRDLLDAMHDDDLEGHHVIFLEYSYAQELLIEKLYVGNIHYINYQNSRYRIHYQVTHEITSPLVIDNFMRYSTLSLERDFEEDSHISIEDSAPLMRQLYYAINCPQNYLRQDVTYSPLEGEGQFSEFAQRNEYCKRLFNIAEPSVARGEYQRDYDRIVHSKAFRRMVDKAQIFSASKGDHYRTRMTHTLGVTQIARSIASRLHMNVPLTEAIALAHDLGHTPFGHQGERTLDQLARKYAEIGFKHNFQSLKVASVLEERYVQCTGMDLSVQVLEGIWKHTKIRKHRDAPLLCEIEDFLPYGIAEEQIALLHPEDNFCSTIEGQIVFIADEIAQRSHDLDDALTAGLLSMDNVLDALSLKKLHRLKAQIENLKQNVADAKENQRMFVSERELLVGQVASLVINYFVNDVVTCYEEFLESERMDVAELREYFQQHHCVSGQVLHFSTEGKVLNDYLETIVTKQVINSPEVAAFDDKAKRIVAKLFELYYENPRLLHDGTLQRIFIETRKRTKNVIHFQDGDIGLVNDEWARIKDPENSTRVRDLQKLFPDQDFTEVDSVKEFQEKLKEGSREFEQVHRYQSSCTLEYQEKKRILVRAICDFISGMTDTYATEEHKKLLY